MNDARPIARRLQFRHWFALPLAVGALLLAASPAPADQIVLTDGQTVEGQIVSEDADVVVFQDESKAQIRFKKTRIASISRGMSPSMARQKADEALQLGNLDEALAGYQKALELGGKPDELHAQINEVQQMIENKELAGHAATFRDARRFLDEGNFEEAENLLTPLLEELPKGERAHQIVVDFLADLYYRRAQRLRDSIKYPEAERELRKAIELDPSNAIAYIELGELNALSSRTHGQAIGFYLKGLALGQDSLPETEVLRVAFELARLYDKQDDLVNAIRWYRFVHEKNPRYNVSLDDLLVEDYRKLAEEKASTDRAMAITALREALKVRPDDADLRDLLAASLLENKDYEAAIAELEALLKVNPNTRRANERLAFCYLEKGDILKARDHFEQEVEMYPDSWEALCALGDIASRGTDYELAKNFYKKAYDAEPTFPRAIIQLGRAERQLSNYAEAREWIQKALDIKPDDYSAKYEMGSVLREEKKFSEAKKQFDEVIKAIQDDKEEDTPEDKQLLADSFLAKGGIELLEFGPGTANKNFNKALEIVPDYPEAYFAIGNAYRKKYESSKQMDDLVKADENMTKSRELDPANPKFAIELGIFYQQVMAPTDTTNREAYLAKAIKNYNDYINNGGAQVTQVKEWIREAGGATSG